MRVSDMEHYAQASTWATALDALRSAYPDHAVIWYMREDVEEHRVDDDDNVLAPMTDGEWDIAKDELVDGVYHVVSNTDLLYDIARHTMPTEGN